MRRIGFGLMLGVILAVVSGLTWRENRAGAEAKLGPRALVVPQWQQLAATPDPDDGSPAARFDHVVEYHAATNKLYLFGGLAGGVYFNDVWSLDLATLTWEELYPNTPGVANTSYPAPRITAIMSLDEAGQFLYLATGQNGGTEYNDVWRFNLSSKSWQKLCTGSPCTNTTPELRYGAAGASLGGDLIISHGFSAGRYDNTWRFDTSAGQWEKLSPASGLPLGRCLLDGALVGNTFMIHGGQSNPDPYRADTWLFNLNSESWTQAATGGVEGVDKPDARRNQSLTGYEAENGFLLFGGAGEGNVHLNDVWFFSLDTQAWQELAPTGTKPSARRSQSAAWVPATGGRPPGMLLFGGTSPATGARGDLWLLGFPTPPVGNPGTLHFTNSSYSVAETGVQATITVTRSDGFSGTVSVQYETGDGTATAGEDYTERSGTLTFAHNEAGPKSFTVPVFSQPTAEGDETVTLALKNPTGGATLGSPDAAVLTILDTNTAGLLQYTLSSYGVPETQAQATISVRRVSGAGGTVTVAYETAGGTAVVGQDYTPVSGTLTFNPGETGPKNFAVPLADDAAPDGDKTVNLILSMPTGGAALGEPAAATLTLFDSDAAGQLHFTLSSFTAHEAAGQAMIKVSRTGGISGAVTIDYETGGGSAGAGSEYTPVTGTLVFNPNQAGPKSFSVPLFDDAVADGPKTVNLALKNPTGGAALGAPNTATLTILDSDAAGRIRFTTNQFNVEEGTGTAVISVTRTGGLSGTVTVSYQASGGTAAPNTDYTPASGALTFGHNQAGPKQFKVTILADETVENTETIKLVLKSPGGGAALGSPKTATLAILDDDEAQSFIYLPTLLKLAGGGGDHDADLIFEE